MYVGPVTPELLRRSVISVPPFCRDARLAPSRKENGKLVRHLEAGGVTTLLYGGNANFYNIASGELPAMLDMLEELAAPESWIIPSCGPDYGKLMDQAPALKARRFPTAMVLPLSFPATPDGVEAGIRRFADAYGKPVIAYVKFENYLRPDQLAALVSNGIVCAIKYAIVRSDPARDDYLAELCKVVDRSLIVSGIGERPVVAHFSTFGIRAFTSGSVCVAPRASDAIRVALHAGNFAEAERIREAFLPLEDLRDAISPLRVLHAAVALAGIAETGPALPMLSDLDQANAARVREAAAALAAYDRGLKLAA